MDFSEIIKDTNSKKSPPSASLLIFGTVVSSLAFGVTVISLPFVFPFFRRVCLPYVPATTQQVKNVLEALKGRTGTLVDLGSGDGRIVIAAAQKGFQSTGVELNPWLVIYSKAAAFHSGVYKETKFLKHDLWKFNLKNFENIVIFGVDVMMEQLENKFVKELNPNTYIVACRFPLSKMKPIKTIGIGIDTVWVYHLK